MADRTGFACLRAAVPAGQGSDLVALAPATSFLPTAALSVTGGQLRRLRLALRTVEDLDRVDAGPSNRGPAALVAVPGTPQSAISSWTVTA